MSYTIIVQKRADDASAAHQEIYKQTVEVLDIKAVMAAVNKTPRKPRTPKKDEK